MGYDSRQSLGEKETGAKAALPIWMTFMKAAIAGKDGEQFLSDTPDDKTLKAAAEPTANPGGANPPTVPSPAKAEPKIMKTSAALKPSAAPPAGISEKDLAAKPVLPAKAALKDQPKPVTGSVPPKSQVKPAFSPNAAPVKPTALERDQDLKLPRSQISSTLDSR